MENGLVSVGRSWGGAGSREVQGDQAVKVEGTHPLRQRWGCKPVPAGHLISWTRSPKCLGEQGCEEEVPMDGI
jgi:hypothetical protein